MDRCGRHAFLLRTDKRVIQCYGALASVPNQTSAPPPRDHKKNRDVLCLPASFRFIPGGQLRPCQSPGRRSKPRASSASKAGAVNPIPPSKCQIARERCVKATGAMQLPRWPLLIGFYFSKSTDLGSCGITLPEELGSARNGRLVNQNRFAVLYGLLARVSQAWAISRTGAGFSLAAAHWRRARLGRSDAHPPNADKQKPKFY